MIHYLASTAEFLAVAFTALILAGWICDRIYEGIGWEEEQPEAEVIPISDAWAGFDRARADHPLAAASVECDRRAA